MNTARLVVLAIAVVAGGIAALLAGGGSEDRPAPAPPPVALLDSVESLVARADIGLGQRDGADPMQWQTWPTAAAGPSLIRRNDKPDAIDVIPSRRDREAEKATGGEVHTSETIRSNVRVPGIDQTVEEKGGRKVVVDKTATVELSPQQADSPARARQMRPLSLAWRSILDIKGAPVDAGGGNERRAGDNMVRFGVTTTPK